MTKRKMQIHIKKLKKIVQTVTIKIPNDYEPSAIMIFDDEGMRCFEYALINQSRRIKETLIDSNYTGKKEWLCDLLQTNNKMQAALDKSEE